VILVIIQLMKEPVKNVHLDQSHLSLDLPLVLIVNAVLNLMQLTLNALYVTLDTSLMMVNVKNVH